MASGGALKGITIQIGGDVTDLSKALSECSAKSRETGQELTAIEKALKFNPDSVELLAQKEKYASEQAANLRERLNAVSSALDSGQVQSGTKAYDRLQRELITTTSRIKDMESRAESARSALSAMEGGADSAAIGLDRMADTGAEIVSMLDDLSSGVSYAVGEDVFDMAKELASSVFEYAEAWDTAAARAARTSSRRPWRPRRRSTWPT